MNYSICPDIPKLYEEMLNERNELDKTIIHTFTFRNDDDPFKKLEQKLSMQRHLDLNVMLENLMIDRIACDRSLEYFNPDELNEDDMIGTKNIVKSSLDNYGAELPPLGVVENI